MMPLSEEMKALGRAQGEAAAAFFANPSPLNRAAYMNAVRRSIAAQFRGRPKVIRYLSDAYGQMMDEVQADHAACESGAEE
jgi:hypothetical protein